MQTLAVLISAKGAAVPQVYSSSWWRQSVAAAPTKSPVVAATEAPAVKARDAASSSPASTAAKRALSRRSCSLLSAVDAIAAYNEQNQGALLKEKLETDGYRFRKHMCCVLLGSERLGFEGWRVQEPGPIC
jgi:hypothetical protein